MVWRQNITRFARLRGDDSIPRGQAPGADGRDHHRQPDPRDFRIFTLDFSKMSQGYSVLREHAAWLDLSGRGKIKVTGEDRARLLHAMTTNHIDRLKPGEGCYAFFLNAQGRILGDVNLLCFDDHFLLDTEPETRTKLFEHLDRYIIADDVTVEDRTDRMATIALEG